MSRGALEAEGPSRQRWSLVSGVALVLAIVGIAWILRSYRIDLRPFHNDEGVNYHFIQELFAKGYYPYSHENYHGPTYFYLTAAFVALFGTSEIAMRGSAVAAGLLLILTPLLVVKDCGRRFVAIAMLLLTVSCSLVFYSRYAIHEMLFGLLGVWFALCAYRWARGGGPLVITQGVLALGLLIATKETFIITFGAVALGVAAISGFAPALRALWRDRAQFFAAGVGTSLVVAAIFTGAFQWPQGLREMVFAVPQWIGRGHSDYGHFKSWWYYLDVYRTTEPLLLVAIALPILAGVFGYRSLPGWLRDPAYTFPRFAFVWGVMTLLVYSAVSYKTPWLVVSITAPLLLSLAWWIDRIFLLQQRGAFVGWFTVALVVIESYSKMMHYTFIIPYGALNPHSYVHTTAGMLDLVKEIRDYRVLNPEARILVGVPQYWPLPYYLRGAEKYVGYITTNDPERYAHEYDVLIVEQTVTWRKPGWRARTFRLSDVQETTTFFRDQTAQ